MRSHGGCARLFMRRRGQPDAHQPVRGARKCVFAGPPSSGPGGVRLRRRRCDDGVAFERENLSQLGRAGGGAKDEKFDADRGFSPPRVQLSPHSCDLKLSRACSSCRAAYGQLQEGRRPSTAQAKPNTSRPRTRTPTRAGAAFTKRRPRFGTSAREKHPRRLVPRGAPSNGLLPVKKRKQRRAARPTGTATRVRSVTSGGRAGRLAR